MAEKRNIYRKAALDRLSSPDQLDKPITIIPSGIWFAIAGGLIASLITLAWAIWGRIPQTVQTNGIYTYGEGVNSIYAANGGIVSDVYVMNGDTVEEGDIIAELDNSDIDTRIDNINERLAQVEAVTLDSTDDEGNADNKEMLDLKSQLLTVDNNKNLDDKILADKEQQLADQAAKTDAAKATMDSLRDQYYASLDEGSSTRDQLEMNDAKDAVNEARNKLQAAKSDYQYAKNDIATAKNDVVLAKNDVASAKSDLDRIKNYNQTAKNDVNSARSDLVTAENDLNTAQNYLDSSKNSLTTAIQQYISLLRGPNYPAESADNYRSEFYDGTYDEDSNYITKRNALIKELQQYNEELVVIIREMNSMAPSGAEKKYSFTWQIWKDNGITDRLEAVYIPEKTDANYPRWVQYMSQAEQAIAQTYSIASTIKQLDEQKTQYTNNVKIAEEEVKNKQG